MKTIKITTGISKGVPQDFLLLEDSFRYFEGLRIDITIERHKTRRTNPQNKYLWGCVWPGIQEFLEEQGIDINIQEIHEHYISKGYFGMKDSKIDGDMIPKRSHESSTLEFAAAIERLQREWSIRGLVIPDPGQTDFI